MRALRRSVSIAVLMVAAGLVAPLQADELRGVALVIGQADYESLGDLGNPLNDARAMDDLLSDLGFDVTRVLDRGGDRFRREIEDFIADAEGADVALVYYAGHAVEAGGQNYLVPIDADLSTPAAAGASLVPVADLLDDLARLVPVTILLLDACRTEAFPDGTQILLPGEDTPVAVVPTGLGEMRGPTPVLANIDPESLGMVIGFASAPGEAALDGAPGTNSPYAAALLKHLAAGGFAFGDLMTMVAEEVYLKTGAQQVPWMNSSLRRVLSFEAVEETGDDEALIRDGRRRLLLSIAATPADVRRQVETAATNAAVPMDTLYGLLDALGQDAPRDPAELDQLLKTQTETIRNVMLERATLTSTDGEIVRLAELAQRALDEGALTVSVGFWEKAKARYAEISTSLDATEAMLRERRLEGGALLARTAHAYGLSGDFASAAENFRLAFAEVERWDDGAAFEYKASEGEWTYVLGVQAGNNAALTASVGMYLEALSLTTEGSREWATLQREIGNSYAQLATRDGRSESVAAAVDAYARALTIFDRESEPLEWASLQTRLAAALSIQGELESHVGTLEAAVDAYVAALDVLSREATPYEWGLAQNNLGNTLRTLGERQASPQTLMAAADALNAALSVTSVESQPFDWAMTQNNLGATLLMLGMRRGDEAMMLAAVDAFNSSLMVMRQDRAPLQWAKLQGNMGAALSRLGEVKNDPAYIEQATVAFRAALTELTPERSLLDWSTATNNLANALTFLGDRGMGQQYLTEAVAAYREVARVLGRERAPLQWAQAQNNLGAALLLIGERGGGQPAFEEALAAIELALEIWTQERVPLDWAMARRNAGHVLVNIGIAEQGTATLSAAVAAYRDALTGYTPDRVPIDWANLQFRLGSVLLEIGLREPAATQAFEESIAAYDAALTFYRREADPLRWADTTNGRAWAMASGGYYMRNLAWLREARGQIDEVWRVVREAGILDQDAYFSDRLAIVDGAIAELSPAPG
jgi:uncharacterized caspase-like protein